MQTRANAVERARHDAAAVGLERRILTPVRFSLLVPIAIVTTLMATPVFSHVYSGKTIVQTA